jgi:hypothetical protein
VCVCVCACGSFKFKRKPSVTVGLGLGPNICFCQLDLMEFVSLPSVSVLRLLMTIYSCDSSPIPTCMFFFCWFILLDPTNWHLCWELRPSLQLDCVETWMLDQFEQLLVVHFKRFWKSHVCLQTSFIKLRSNTPPPHPDFKVPIIPHFRPALGLVYVTLQIRTSYTTYGWVRFVQLEPSASEACMPVDVIPARLSYLRCSW